VLNATELAEDDLQLLSVGAVAGQLGVAPATVRSWERRYGLGPGGRSQGGHRRYTQADLGRLLSMQDLITAGQPPAAAARAVLHGHVERGPSGRGVPAATTAPRRPADQPKAPDGGRRRPGGPGGRVLAVPGASPEVRGLARAASRMDADALIGQVGDLLVRRGATRTWNEVLQPLLVSIGVRWARVGVDVEHLLSEAIIEALRAYRAFLPRPAPGRPVLLACAPEEQHSLPLHALAAGLTELRVPVRLLGGRVPTAALPTAARRTGAGGLFLWRHFTDTTVEPDELAELGDLPPSRPSLRLVVGGLGWQQVAVPAGARYAPDLVTAVRLLQ
jgi:hypothetical protein